MVRGGQARAPHEYKIDLGQTDDGAPVCRRDHEVHRREVNEGAALDAEGAGHARRRRRVLHADVPAARDAAAGNTATPTVIEVDTEKLVQ